VRLLVNCKNLEKINKIGHGHYMHYIPRMDHIFTEEWIVNRCGRTAELVPVTRFF
jgi:hypothetical protein